MTPQFTVILPTYNRPQLAKESLLSVQNQTFTNWQLVIVIDDIEADYTALEEVAKEDTRIVVLKNKTNLGKNTSVNNAFAHLREHNFSGYVVFLDDDDTLAPDCLLTFAKEIELTNSLWLVSQRANQSDKKSLTRNRTSSNRIDYLQDMLILRKFSGETTHCIDFKSTKNCQFPSLIKNAEEWIYFAQVAAITPSFHYIEKAGTYTGGYLADGLSNKKRDFAEKWTVYKKLWQEVKLRHLNSFFVYLYLMMRSITLFK